MKKYELLFVVRVEQIGEDEYDAMCRARINMDLFRGNRLLEQFGSHKHTEFSSIILDDAQSLMIKEIKE